MRVAIGALCLQDNRVLLVCNNRAWTLPGGTPETGETDEVCLEREFSEELPWVDLSIQKLYGEFSGRSPHVGDAMLVKVYLAELEGDFTPAAEISEARFFSAAEAPGINLSEITRKIIDSLIESGRLK